MGAGIDGLVGGSLPARVSIAPVSAFVLASVVAAVGYPEWAWVFVFSGLVLAPVVLVVALVILARNRLSRRS